MQHRSQINHKTIAASSPKRAAAFKVQVLLQILLVVVVSHPSLSLFHPRFADTAAANSSCSGLSIFLYMPAAAPGAAHSSFCVSTITT